MKNAQSELKGKHPTCKIFCSIINFSIDFLILISKGLDIHRQVKTKKNYITYSDIMLIFGVLFLTLFISITSNLIMA